MNTLEKLELFDGIMIFRHRFNLTLVLLFTLTLGIAGCTRTPSNMIDIEGHQKEIEEWKARRLARLTSETGWLTLAGLYWLLEGENTFGSDSSNHIVLPFGKAPKIAGSIFLEDGRPRVRVQPGVPIKVNDSLVSSMMLQTDRDRPAGPTILTLGTVSFYVIKRGDQFGVRVRDTENPARTDFKGLDYFTVDPKWRFEARFEPYDPPRILEIPTQVGTVQRDSCPGALVFELDGRLHRLDAVIEAGAEDQLFIMFGDATNGGETYYNGRQVYTALPDSLNRVVLDFNKAYNWPCVFTDFATCPIPPKQNQLAIRIEAGEKMYHSESVSKAL